MTDMPPLPQRAAHLLRDTRFVKCDARIVLYAPACSGLPLHAALRNLP